MRRAGLVAIVALGACREPAPGPGAATAAGSATVAGSATATGSATVAGSGSATATGSATVAGSAADPAPVADVAAPPPADLDDALARLRAAGLDGAADAIARRAAQRARKMRLEPDAALAAAIAVLDLAADGPLRALHDVMPRSTVELARAVRERDLPRADADAIAAYLVRFTDVLAFERLATFDENHSHVTGRRWPEIDYTGEGMTWQGQRDYWGPRGVADFRTAASIHAYFVGAEPLPHWDRVYRPRGRVADVAAP